MRLTAVLLACLAPVWAASRTTISLDGAWQLADSVAADAFPKEYSHTAPVPGLAHSATPAFADVDQFDSRQVIQNRVARGLLPKSAIVTNAGVSRQERNWFWYRRMFDVARKSEVAVLRINKAQFGASVWLNGVKVGEHLPCFTAAIFDVSRTVREGRNELVIRVGAHPGVLPETVSAGTDFEKNRWTPGIYDSVSLALSGSPTIETVQVAPRLASSSILVQTQVRNAGSGSATFNLTQRVGMFTAVPLRLTLGPRETRIVTQEVSMPNAKLWWPEEPNLYVLETDTGGDSVRTRFGMREFRFDTATRRAWLNGRVYFLRGSNITLHRFFEDPKSGVLPWNEQWVRKLLVDIPKQMHWNAFRFCIGPVPDRWLEIADEAGLLIQNEYFVWTGRNWHGAGNQVRFDGAEMIAEYKEWLRDNWNHPSVAIWDANNETFDPLFAEKIIPAVRGLDLSNRPWENSYNGPAGPDDPVEDHPYEFQTMSNGGAEFSMTTLERPNGKAPGAATGHAMILNEYGWLWLNRDGSPTELTKKLYPRLVGENATAEDRLAMNAYLLGGITEYWRAYRQYAGVLHFVYLTSSDPLGYTADHFRDVEKLELDPHFKDYMSNAFAPLGVYLSFWKPTLDAGSTPSFQVMLVNDDPRTIQGTIAVSLENAAGEVVSRREAPFSIGSLGQETYYIALTVPRVAGRFTLKAVANGVQSRRSVTVVSR
jgi:beta-galactosidase